MGKFQFETTCVSARGDDINDMVDKSTDITRKTFLKYVDRDELTGIEKSLGYDTGHERG